MEIEVTREGTVAAIEEDIKAFSEPTKWRLKPNDEVIEMGRTFCNELIGYANTLEDMHQVHCMSFFSSIAGVFIGSTRCFEKLSEEELKTIGNIFDEMRSLRTEFIEGCEFDIIFDKMIYAKDIFVTNSICRKDYEGAYRQNMIFPDFSDVYEIIHKIDSNWEKLKESEDFSLLFILFRKEWYRSEVSAEGDYIADFVYQVTCEKPKTAVQDKDPGFWARKFMSMLDERINK